ncbi:prolipoprotein diacylglyceryl transferase [Zwartia sp.]|uniref:prolipoprotein diacylglyceryl transferase n=1 Tax=Zwartia sp. TaxID=2978004 RepID=UPI002719894D|nr:prolipoprotein diacylglyceryl transferase [Zwartia sp.]MDO9025529.1 prolipoprotein diacylglyceryl transferase [Zwartia sp.]
MLQFPNIDPIALRLGPVAIHWYGLMYLVAFGSAWLLGRWRIKHHKTTLTLRDLEDLIFYGVLAVVAGGRLGYVLFYKPAYYLAHPLEVFYLWEGGMSFHGGLLGVVLMIVWLARSRGYPLLAVGDFVSTLIPLGLATGRLGNFINGELWGRTSTLPWAMVFPQSGDGLARHPSQLYQLGLEGLALFVLVWWFAHKPRPMGQVTAVFLMGYGFFRFLAEFAREPDNFLGLLAAGLTMGQWLSLPMIAVGLGLFVWAKKNNLTYPPSR